jgi:hypothetical protein
MQLTESANRLKLSGIGTENPYDSVVLATVIVIQLFGKNWKRYREKTFIFKTFEYLFRA